MQNPRLAARYAKSLMDIAKEQQAVEAVYADALSMHNMFAGSAELVSLVKSPIIKADAKQNVFKALIGGKANIVTEQFTHLVIGKGREYFLPEVMESFIALYKVDNNITTVTLTTAHALDAATQANLLEKISAQLQGKKIDLINKVDESLIGGFVLESNNNLFDASIARDLKDIKKQFMDNAYIPKMVNLALQ
jgi:F-type H+-transporting ATPase subunit delta